MYDYPIRSADVGLACGTIVQTLNYAAFYFTADSILTVGGMQVLVHCHCSI